ncbi:MAG: Holliday junction branch migration protein RuvA [Planctomycetota bacterium]|jgi:Holliday junction DNA helicase RuvA
MIVRLRGTLIEVGEEAIVIERDGVAREVLVPPFAIGELAAHRGREVTLHTVEFYEGNQMSGQLVPRLLGFLHTEDRLFFSRFVNVKGIGPRKAMKALAEPVRRIAFWIESGDTKALARLPGIGARAAQLIVASLKGKMDDLAMAGAPDATDAEAVRLTQAQHDALEVLIAWGDSGGDARRWLERAIQLRPDLVSADEWVRTAYRVKTGVEG